MQAKNSEKVPVTTCAKEGAIFESILPQQKKGDDDETRLEFGEGTSANESAVLETILPQQKKGDDGNTRLEFGEATSAKEGAVLETLFPPSKKMKTTLIYAKITDAS